MALGGIFDFAFREERLEEILRELESPDVWNDPERAQALGRERAQLEAIVLNIREIEGQLRDSKGLLELAEADEDAETVSAIEADLATINRRVEDLEFRRMFSGEMDPANAYLDIQAGSGGTEAQDWANMLLRMYLRWGERRGFRTEIIELSDAEVAGIKSATVRFEGEYAFGWLRTETGVHRLVRKSPFDSGNRRHTSFAAVFVSPEIDDSIEIEINPADLRVDTYRASGAGGQHVNKTDSAVRLTHLPTGIVVECQDERSQHKNRARAMSLLQARLMDAERSRRVAAQAQDRRLQVGSGDRSERIRTYNFPQGRVTDHRISLTLYRLDDVLAGDLDQLIEPLANEYQADQLAALAE
jgi:peptide chain release factor 2